MTITAWEVAARDFETVRPPAWKKIARPEQLPPAAQWLVWAFIAGRGAGKTRSAAEWVHEQAKDNPGCRIALVGRTPADVRDVMIEGESGILAVAHDGKPVYQPTKRRLTWPNGSKAYTYSAEVPSQLRGPQHHFAWADEAAAWTDARKGDVLDTAWNNLMLGLRLGQDPRCAVTTTPKPNALTKTILARPTTAVTRGTTYDNLDNLAPSFRDEVLSAYEGTRIGRQELLGEILDDVEGALWTIALIDGARVKAAPEMRRIVVAIDPSGGEGPDNDEQGIVIAGLGVDGELYVLADWSCRLSPNGWASRAVAAFHEFSADKIVAERNFGGDMVLATIRAVSKTAPVKVITASRGKVQRAEPAAAAYEQGRVHHVGPLARLEDQMTQWTPKDGTSPDRLDALVWALTELTDNFGGDEWVAWARRKAEAAEAARNEGPGESAPVPAARPPTTFSRAQAADALRLVMAGAVTETSEPGVFEVASAGGNGPYRVTADTCGCPAGEFGTACKHRAAVAIKTAHLPAEPPAPIDPVQARKLARDAAVRAQNAHR